MSTYVFSDLHSQYDLWLQIKEYIKPEDTVYCLGDCMDRGDAGLKILFEVLNTPNIILLCGNHEDFIKNTNISLWYRNGGDRSIHDFEKLSKQERRALIKRIRKLPTHIEYTNTRGEVVYLCHAGRQPDTPEISYEDNYIWDRSHIKEKEWRGADNEYCVHGHTPVCVLKYFSLEWPEDNTKIYRYCKGHKIDIDLGSFQTHVACLLNLDTWEEIYFKDRTIKE